MDNSVAFQKAESGDEFASIELDGTTTCMAEMVSSLTWENLPAELIEHAKDLVLDYVGVTLYGSTLPWSRQVRELIQEEAGREESTILGFGKVPMRGAALVNGSAAHAAELDDSHDESLTHPGGVVLSAALATGEAHSVNGRDFLVAMIAGYEVQCRIGNAIGEKLLLRGWHPTASCGVFGAAATVGSLLRFEAATIVNAFGAAASMASGLMQFTQDPIGTSVKRLYAGLPAERGVFAAQLARKGFASPRQSIEGRWGFSRVMAGSNELSRRDALSMRRWEAGRTAMKLYSTCKLFHSLIEAIDDCRKQRTFSLDDIVSVEPYGPRQMIDSHMERRPRSMMAAQYSLPFVTAVCLTRDPRDPNNFSEPVLHDPVVLRFVDLVTPQVDETLDSLFPKHVPGGIRIGLKDGTTVSSTKLDSRSSAESRIDREEIHRKFRTLTAPMIPPDCQDQIIDVVYNLERTKTISQLTGLLQNRIPC